MTDTQTNIETYTKNILNVYHSISATDNTELLASGMNWYSAARDFAAKLATENNISFDVACGIIAVLSPNQSWLVQLRYTDLFIKFVISGIDTKNIKTYGYNANKVKAAMMLATNSVFPYLSGPKVTAFYKNIKGDFSECTLDVWAMRIALNDYKCNVSKYNRANTVSRDELIIAYYTAANELNLPVAILQSVVWTIARGKAI